ncbi:MAG: DUF4230 domain-containing protein [Fimbriimonadaceae bacterium]|nr:DUF4230 domain-containing protein [Fimbriimonadaceae bacterium]
MQKVSRGKVFLAIGLVALVGGLTWVGGRYAASASAADERTMVLERVRTMDRLATIERVYTGVWRSESSRGADGFWEFVPGADAISRSLTSNSALVSYTARVQAGIELDQVAVSDEGDRLVIHLPAPWIEGNPGNVNAESVQSGLLWRNNNMTLTAEREAVAEARKQAVKGGISGEAIDSAAVQLNRFLDPIVEKPLEFRAPGGRVIGVPQERV